MKRTASIDDLLQPLDKTPIQAYLSSALQVADVLDWVLAQLGPSEVWQTTFSISDEYLRRLFFIRKKGNLRRVTCLLDFKATNKTIKLWPFICQTIEDARLADNHSKVLLIRSVDGRVVTVNTSQNLTRGNRAESSIITTDQGIFDTLMEQMQDILTNHSVPLHAQMQERIEANSEDNAIYRGTTEAD